MVEEVGRWLGGKRGEDGRRERGEREKGRYM